MRIHLFFFSACLFLLHTAEAQTTAPITLGIRRSILTPVREYPEGACPLFAPTHFRTGEDQPWQRTGLFGGRLKKPMAFHEPALQHLKRHQSARIAGAACGLGATVSFVMGLAYFNPFLTAMIGIAPEPGDGLTRKPAFWFVAAGVLYAGGIVLNVEATRHLKKGVATYNAERIPPPKPSITFKLRPVASETGSIGMGLAVAW